jgi:hypothetical protein
MCHQRHSPAPPTFHATCTPPARDAFDLEHIPVANRIPRIPARAAASFFDGFYRRDRPVIITGLVREWPCYRKWTIDHLKQVFGGQHHTFRYEEGRTITLRVADYLDAVAASDRGTGFAGAFPPLPSRTERLPYMRHFGPLSGSFDAEYPIRSLFPDPGRFNFSSFLFCGVPSTKTNCHHDWTHNFVGVIRGTKHVTLLPPRSEQYMNVSCGMKRLMATGHCEFFDDPATLQLRPGSAGCPMHQHPVFKNCPALYYSPLRAGDVVFFPAYWYHYFHNIEGSISVSTQSCPLQ